MHSTVSTMMNFQDEYDYLFKVVVVGNSAVGKSSLVLKYADDVFNEAFLPTIGVDFRTKTLVQNDKVIKLQIWDTAGQERFRTIVGQYWRGSIGVLVLFDLTDRQSFKDLEFWVREVDKFTQRENEVCILIGTKNDLVDKRQISTEQAQSYAQEIGMIYMEVSAKTGQNVGEVFQTICERGLQVISLKEKQKPNHQVPSSPVGENISKRNPLCKDMCSC